MSLPALEVADIFRDHGAAWRKANAGHVSLDQMKVMSAIERCRAAALCGHVAHCENEKCAHTRRHCRKCQGGAAREWLAEREAELLPVPLCSVTTYVLRKKPGISRTGQCACLTEHKFLGGSNPLFITLKEGSTCSTSYLIAPKP